MFFASLLFFGEANAQCTQNVNGNLGAVAYGAGDYVCLDGNVTGGTIVLNAGAVLDYNGFTNAGSISVNSGATVYMSGNNFGAIVVYSGANVVVCGDLNLQSTSMTVNAGGKLTLSAGSTLDINASTLTFLGGNNGLDYTGDLTCKAQIIASGGGAGHVGLANPDVVTDHSQIWLSGFTYGYAGAEGSANIGVAAGALCAGVAGCGVTACTVAAASSSPTVCINTAMTNITHATSGVSSITSTSGLPTGVTASYAADVITISGTPTSAAATYNYTIETDCGEDATGTIIVTANNTAAAGSSSPTLCVNTALTAITHATTGATGISNDGAAGANGLPGGVSATWAGNTITISGTPTADGTFNYSIPLTGGCGTVNATGTITVTANNTAGAASSTQTVCLNTAITAITHATTGATGISNDGVDAANGLPAGVSATWAGNTITISGTPSADGTFNYSIPLTGGCGTVNATGTITVYAAMTAGTIGSDQTVNVGATPAALTETVAHTGGVAAYTYLWESSTNNVTWAAAAGTNDQATYSPGALSASTWFRRTVTSGSGCGAATSNTVSITVTMTVCSGSSPSTVNSSTAATQGGAGSPTYQWEVSTDNQVTWSDAPGTSNQATYDPGSVTQDVWYRRKATINGCVGYRNVLKAGVTTGSPGGIGGALVWLKADAGTGSIGTQWEDQSGNGNHYTTVSGPTLVSGGDSSSNYNPYIRILDGGFDAPAGAQLGANYTLFAVAKKLSSATNGVLFDGHISSYSIAFSSSTDTLKSVQVVTSASVPATGVQVDINTGFSAANCDANVYELIIYSRVLSSDSIEIIESYLETKYGIEGGDTYVSSLGATTFDVSSYNNDVIGIGKECYFHQKQSSSLDDSLRVTVSSTGSMNDWGTHNSTNTQSVTADVSYLMIGHNGGSMKGTSSTSADVPPPGTLGSDGSTPITILSRIDREWKITNTNFSDNYAIKFEVIPDGLTANDIVFMVDDDGDFTSGATLYFNGDGSGISISIGSIIVGGLGPGIIPAAGAGAPKFVALGSKDEDSPLPVELVDFKAQQKEDYNLISWVTQSEINSSHFVVQKSIDGINWEEIALVYAAGNSDIEQSYEVLDAERCAEKCYYRLHQIDLSGESEFSQVVLIHNAEEEASNLFIYPIPVRGAATIDFVAPSTGMYGLEVFSVSGASTYAAKVVCVKGENEFEINTSDYASGMYYLIIRDMSGEIINKVTFTK